MKYTAKRISSGHYKYRGFNINCLGYYGPDKKVVWEAVDKYGNGFAHSYSLKETKQFIDMELEKRSTEIKETL